MKSKLNGVNGNREEEVLYFADCLYEEALKVKEGVFALLDNFKREMDDSCFKYGEDVVMKALCSLDKKQKEKLFREYGSIAMILREILEDFEALKNK